MASFLFPLSAYYGNFFRSLQHLRLDKQQLLAPRVEHHSNRLRSSLLWFSLHDRLVSRLCQQGGLTTSDNLFCFSAYAFLGHDNVPGHTARRHGKKTKGKLKEKGRKPCLALLWDKLGWKESGCCGVPLGTGERDRMLTFGVCLFVCDLL